MVILILMSILVIFYLDFFFTTIAGDRDEIMIARIRICKLES